jgi:multicomponent Na+:H+ antiporter subunit G
MSGGDWLAVALLLAGVFFHISGTVGLLRLPDPLSRLHALTKADNLGLLLIMLGLLAQHWDPLLALKLLVIWLLVLGAGATGAHLIAKRAMHGDGEDTP